MMKIVLIGALLILATGLGIVIAYPHVPRLIAEGFPPQVMENTDGLVRVDGADTVEQFSFAPPPNAALIRFNKAKGAALLVDQAGLAPMAAYGGNFDPEMRLNSYSMVKSLVGLLVVRAFALGDLPNLNASARDILGRDAPDIKISALLAMSGGLAATSESVKRERDEGYSPFSTLGKMHINGVEPVYADLTIRTDWVGTFHYQSANTALLGRILELTYQQSLAQLLSDVIWQPAGASDAYWRSYPKGEGISAYCCLYARPQDWLRVGRFILENGTTAAPLLPATAWQKWVLPDLAADVRIAGAYGDHLRHDILDRKGAAIQAPFAYAMGHRGQVMYLVPDLNAVVVRFGDEPQLLHSTLYEILQPLPLK